MSVKWLVVDYRRESTLWYNATMRMGTFCLMAVLALIGGGLQTSAAPSATTKPDELQVELPGFGISLHGPDHCFRAFESSTSQLAFFILIQDQKAVGACDITATPKKGRSVVDAAKTLGDEWNGSVIEKPGWTKSPDGAVEIKADSADPQDSVRAGVFEANGSIVVARVEEGDPEKASKDLADLMASIKLSKPTPAVDELTLRRRPLQLFGSAVLLPLPEPFRPVANTDKPDDRFFGVHDWPTGKGEASLRITKLDAPAGASLADICDKLGKLTADRMQLSEPVKFSQVNKNPESYISTTFTPPGKDTIRIVQMRIDDAHIAVLTFQSKAPTQAVRDKYMETAEKIAAAARVSQAAKEGYDSVAHPK